MYSPKLWIYLREITRYTNVHGFLSIKTNVRPWVHWQSKDGITLLHVTTNVLCHHAMTSLSIANPEGTSIHQKNCGIYLSQMQVGGKCCNLVGIPILHLVQNMENHNWWALIRSNLKETRTSKKCASFALFHWRTIHIGS